MKNLGTSLGAKKGIRDVILPFNPKESSGCKGKIFLSIPFLLRSLKIKSLEALLSKDKGTMRLSRREYKKLP